MTAPVLQRHQGDIHHDANPAAHQRRFIQATTDVTNVCVKLGIRPVSVSVFSCHGLRITVHVDSPDEVGTLAEHLGLELIDDDRGPLTFYGDVTIADMLATVYVYGSRTAGGDE